MLEDTAEDITLTFKPVFLPDTPLPGMENEIAVPEAPELPGKTEDNTSTSITPIALPVPRARTALPEKGGKSGKRQKQKAAPEPVGKRAQLHAYMTQERCRHLCLSIFFREQTTVRSLGFTSSINGEGKSFLALTSARALARDSGVPVTLLECNWEHPSVHEYAGIALTPGLAEYLRGEAVESSIRYRVDNNLTIIPAGNGKQDAVRLTQQLRKKGSLNNLLLPDELFIVDLPPVITTAYGALIAGLVDALIVVVRAHVTPNTVIAETYSQLKDLPVEGLLLNQVESHIPRWLHHLL
jgi:Mrp family chromosome partitioning ATPase